MLALLEEAKAMTRRELLQAGGVAATVLEGAPGQSTAGAGWFDRPMRWIQIAFVEDDPGRYDLGFWVDYMRRIHADAATLSAGGCVAFYPTRIPLHYRSKWLGGRDAFGELLGTCRKLGMNVVARVDPHACHDDARAAHPDWIAVDAQGRPRRHWAMPDYWVTCALGPYNFEFMTSVVREIVEHYQVDGIFANRWSGSGMCWCVHCRDGFRRFSGLELPRTENPRDEAGRQYILWRQQRLFDLWTLWDGEIRQRNPAAAFIPNTGGGALSEIDMKRAGELAPTLFADRQGRNGLAPVWLSGKNGKEYRAGLGRKPIAGLSSVGLEAPYRWKDSTQSTAELQVWAVDGIAQGLRPWLIKFNAKPTDERWMKPMEEVFTWHWRNEKYLRNERPLARVGLVFSQQTARFYGGADARARVEDAILGAYQALVEARVPFEMVHDQNLDSDHLRELRTLVLPNVAALSEAQCAQLRRFVEQGGGLVATHETSLYDEWGRRRADFGLASLFGASFGGTVIERQQNAYLRVADVRSPLLAGFDDARRLIHGVKRVEVKAHAEQPCPLMTVPTYPDLPMEEVYVRDGAPESPAVFAAQRARGRVVYFPFDIDRTFWEVMHPDHGRLLANAVVWVTNEPTPLQVTGPGLLDLSLWAQASSVTAHIVNLTNPMFMKGPFREIIPVAGQSVRLRLPEGRRARVVRLLVSGAKPSWKQEGAWISVRTPSIALHEVVAVDL
jgi:hypothetical protein